MLLKRKLLAWMALSAMLVSSVNVFAADDDTTPSAGAMAVDALVARPFGLAVTVLGTAAFVVSLPFSALGGNVAESADKLVVGPAKATFVRCLGCKSTGRE